MAHRRYTQSLKKEPYCWNDSIEQATGRAFDWECPFCGADVKEVGYVRAHIAPVGTGVGFIPGNIVLACNECNVTMGQNHAWHWCETNGISYWWMMPILETLAKIFFRDEPLPIIPSVQTNTILPKRYAHKTLNGQKRLMAKQWLSEHPEDFHKTGRELRDTVQPMGIKISHTYWNDAKKALQRESGE